MFYQWEAGLASCKCNALAYWVHSEVRKKLKCCEYGPCSIKTMLLAKAKLIIVNLALAMSVHHDHNVPCKLKCTLRP